MILQSVTEKLAALAAPYVDHHKIALTGLSNSGKTVFLLSMIEQLQKFDPDRFHCDGEICRFKEIPLRNHEFFTPFPHGKYRGELFPSAQKLGKWPEKTTSYYQYDCEFEYQPKNGGVLGNTWRALKNSARIKFSTAQKLRLTFFDFPGDRFADALIAECGNYADWSEKILDFWKNHPATRDPLENYLQTLENKSAPKILLADYKSFLTKLLVNYQALITPSTFMQGENPATVFQKTDLDNAGKNRLCGLRDYEFIPLPREFIAKNAGLAQTFAANYARYRDKIVAPLFAAINSCDAMLFFVDVPLLLGSGVQRLNDQTRMLDSLAKILHPSRWYRLWRWHELKKIGFIASKSDLVHADDRDRLKGLVTQLMRPLKNQHPDLTFEVLPIAALKSAASIEMRQLEGVPLLGNPQREIHRVPAPELPTEFPGAWQAGKYIFTAMQPAAAENLLSPPRQFGLEAVFKFIFNLA